MNAPTDNKPSLTRWETNPRVITGVVVVAIGLVMLIATVSDTLLLDQVIVLLLGVIFLAWGVAVRHPGP
jgi:predicted membrane protein